MLAPSTPDTPSKLRKMTKLIREAPLYRFSLLGPAMAGGAVAMALPPERRRVRALALTVVWASTAGVAVILVRFVLDPPYQLFGLTIAAHRYLAYALGIPVLAAAALAGVARLATRIPPRPVGAVIAAAVVVAGLVASLALAREAWRDPPPAREDQLEQARAAGRYLAGVEQPRPAVFVLQPGPHWKPNPNGRPMFDLIRAALPGEWITRSHIYVGETRDLLRGRPSRRPGDARYDRVSRAVWNDLRPHMEEDPIILVLESVNRGADRSSPGTPLAPGVEVVRGPAPRAGPAPAPAGPSIGRLVGITALALALLFAVGLGWSAGLVPAGWLVRAAAAPALGASVLILGGLLAARIGLIAVAAVLGWLALGGPGRDVAFPPPPLDRKSVV